MFGEAILHDVALFAIHLAIIAPFLVRVMLAKGTETSTRVAWVAVIVGFPFVGILANGLFGNVRVGKRRSERLREVDALLPDFAAATDPDWNLTSGIGTGGGPDETSSTTWSPRACSVPGCSLTEIT